MSQTPGSVDPLAAYNKAANQDDEDNIAWKHQNNLKLFSDIKSDLATLMRLHASKRSKCDTELVAQNKLLLQLKKDFKELESSTINCTDSLLSEQQASGSLKAATTALSIISMKFDALCKSNADNVKWVKTRDKELGAVEQEYVEFIKMAKIESDEIESLEKQNENFKQQLNTVDDAVNNLRAQVLHATAAKQRLTEQLEKLRQSDDEMQNFKIMKEEKINCELNKQKQLKQDKEALDEEIQAMSKKLTELKEEYLSMTADFKEYEQSMEKKLLLKKTLLEEWVQRKITATGDLSEATNRKDQLRTAINECQLDVQRMTEQHAQLIKDGERLEKTCDDTQQQFLSYKDTLADALQNRDKIKAVFVSTKNEFDEAESLLKRVQTEQENTRMALMKLKDEKERLVLEISKGHSTIEETTQNIKELEDEQQRLTIKKNEQDKQMNEITSMSGLLIEGLRKAKQISVQSAEQSSALRLLEEQMPKLQASRQMLLKIRENLTQITNSLTKEQHEIEKEQQVAQGSLLSIADELEKLQLQYNVTLEHLDIVGKEIQELAEATNTKSEYQQEILDVENAGKAEYAAQKETILFDIQKELLVYSNNFIQAEQEKLTREANEAKLKLGNQYAKAQLERENRLKEVDKTIEVLQRTLQEKQADLCAN